MSAIWPPSLQKCIDANTFSASEDPQYISTSVDNGPPKTRRTVTRGWQKIKASIMVDKADYETFMLWWNNDLAGGANDFDFEHPITKAPTKYKFEKPYTISPVGPVNWRVGMEWIQVS